MGISMLSSQRLAKISIQVMPDAKKKGKRSEAQETRLTFGQPQLAFLPLAFFPFFATAFLLGPGAPS